MSIFRKRYVLAGLATLILGLVTVAAVVGIAKFRGRSTTITSEVKVYLLDDQGGVNGLLLASGDQLKFSSQMGQAVQAQVKLGDTVTATGHAGKTSNYGREFRLEQLAFNGHTIVEAAHGPGRGDRGPRGDHRGPNGRDDRDGSRGPRGPQDRRGPGARDDRPEPSAPADSNGPAVAKPETSPGEAPAEMPGTGTTSNAPVAPVAPDPLKASSTIWVHLVNGRGEVNGLILASGEQIRFSPRVGQLIVTAESGANNAVSVEGAGVKNERGTVIRPVQLTVGNQTIALGR